MSAVPGRSCGECNMCCKVLDIKELDKDAGPLCDKWCSPVGCSIYKKRPEVCRDFECDWLTERDVPAALKPSRIGTILMTDPDSDQYQAVCDPKTPNRWRHPQVFKHLVARAKAGEIVVAKAGLASWRVYASGECAPWT